MPVAPFLWQPPEAAQPTRPAASASGAPHIRHAPQRRCQKITQARQRPDAWALHEPEERASEVPGEGEHVFQCRSCGARAPSQLLTPFVREWCPRGLPPTPEALPTPHTKTEATGVASLVKERCRLGWPAIPIPAHVAARKAALQSAAAAAQKRSGADSSNG